MTILLNEKLDLHETVALRSSLSDRRGQALVIDAARVLHLGAQCAQVLAAAVAAWADDGVPLTVAAPSNFFRQGSRLLGLQSILSTEGVPS
jgi:chemotaxis protein CheX